MAKLRSGVRWSMPAATALLVFAGCASGEAGSGTNPVTTAKPTSTSASASTTRRGPQPVEVRYFVRISDPGEEGPLQVRYDIVSDGGTKIRLKESTYVDPVTVGEEILYTWDGSQMLLFSLQNAVPYTIYEAPSEHPNEFQMVTHWRENMWSATQGSRCTELKSTTKVIGRIAVGYRCVTATSHPGEPAAGDLWLDQATGILLKNEVMVAEKLVLNPKVDATTFSTRPPAGAKVTVIAAKNASPGQTKKAPNFTLDLVKGGRIGLKDLVGKPFVLAFFMSDLSFDEKGEVCPGCRDALLTLQTLTGNGAEPRVLGVQVGDLGKPGYPLVVTGVTLTLAHEQTPVVQNSFGLTEMLGFAFVRSDGTVAASYDRAPTKQQITQSLAALH
jgi:peroxiredoxin